MLTRQIPNFLRNHGQHAQAPPSPPSTLPNGASGSHSSVAPSSNMQQHLAQSMASGGDMSWLRQSPSRGLEQITRPVQQILSSPVDKWGLQALLYEIKMGKGDRALLMFGEDLSQMGVDLEQPKWVQARTRSNKQANFQRVISYIRHAMAGLLANLASRPH